MTPSRQSEDEGYAAMTKILRKNPRTHHDMLLAAHDMLQRQLATAQKRGESRLVAQYTTSLRGVREAMLIVVHKLEAEAAEQEAYLLRAAEEEEEAEEEEGDEPSDSDAQAEADGDADEEAAAEEEGEEEGEEEEEAEGEEEEGEEEAIELPEEPPADNPLKMPAKLRRDMGDLVADVLDSYAWQIHSKAMTVFKLLLDKHLILAEEDSDEPGLRDVLLSEVGKRGVEASAPFFNAWRAAVVKQILKVLKEEFTPAAEPDGVAHTDTEPEYTAERDAEQLAEDLDKENVKEPPMAPTPAAPVAQASVAASLRLAGGVVSPVRDFRPSGRGAAKLA